MDEADCYSFRRGLDGEKCSHSLLVPGKDERHMNERVKIEKENETHCNNNHFEPSHPISGKIAVKPFENSFSSRLSSSTSTTASEKWLSPKCIPKDEEYSQSPSIHGEGSFQHHIDYEKSRMETRCGDSSSMKKEFGPEDQLPDTAINSSCCTRYHQEQQNNLPSSIGTDETDQGRVVPNFSLTEQHSEYPTALSHSQYYPKLKESAALNLISDSTLKESSGLSCHPTAISHSHMGHNEESPSAIHHQCSASSTLQGQLESNIKPSVSSIAPVEVEFEGGEVSKRKTSNDEKLEDVHWSRMKRQKISPLIQQEVQYNQAGLSKPTQYQVSGKGNYLFESPSNCTFNLYKSGQDKQHASQWASRQSSQTDSVNGSIPTEPLQTIAKLIAQTTDWKKIARLLPMTECPTLETDIKSLEECQGTTYDKTMAVLMRWWREHPEQGDRATMKECLQRGLECCKLVRLARAIDKYIPDA